MFGAVVGHCNERIGHVGGEDAGEEVKVLVFVFKYMVVELCSDDGSRVLFRWPRALWGESVVRKYRVRSVRGVVGGQDDVVMCGRM